MTGFLHHRRAGRAATTTPSTVIWNTVVPVLGVALLLGAPVLLALVVAAAASIAIAAVLGSPSSSRSAGPSSGPGWIRTSV